MDASYRYHEFTSPLDIRLIKLARLAIPVKDSSPANSPEIGNGERQFAFDLISTNLKDAPPYETVSYVWGPGPHNTANLAIGQNGIIRISQLLMDSLQQLALFSTTGYLWVDQICMNQNDSSEKNHQVQIMGQIYKGCEKVLIYLAPELLPEVDVKNLLFLEQKPSFEHVFTELSIFEHSIKFNEADELRKHFEGLKWEIHYTNAQFLFLLLEHPWFYRGWVIQEVVLAPHAEFVSCGVNLTVRFVETVANLAFTHNRHLISVGHQHFQAILGCKSSNDPLFILDTISPASEFSLVQDHVYGFLGINDRLNMEPDYTLAWWQVFASAAAKLIDHQGTLEILRLVYRLPRGDEPDLNPPISALPSWVPCWSSYGRYSRYNVTEVLPSLRMQDMFAVCRGRKHTLPATADLPYLRTQGGCISRIHALLQIVEDEEDEWQAQSFMMFMREVLRRSILRKESEDKVNGGQSRQEALRMLPDSLPSFWHTSRPWRMDETPFPTSPQDVIARLIDLSSERRYMDRPFDFPKVSSILTMQRMDYTLPDFSRVEPEVQQALAREVRSFRRRHLPGLKVFLLENGLLGFSEANRKIEIGDLVCILHGAELPVILRPMQAKDSKDSQAKYELVDSSNVECCMNGEAVYWEEDDADEFLLG